MYINIFWLHESPFGELNLRLPIFTFLFSLKMTTLNFNQTNAEYVGLWKTNRIWKKNFPSSSLKLVLSTEGKFN